MIPGAKVQPQAKELEEVVLGAMMMEKSAVNAVIDVLQPESFYVEAHGEVFRAIQTLFNKSEPIDLLTVTEQLRMDGKLDMLGGSHRVAELTTRVASSANVEFHARIIAPKAHSAGVDSRVQHHHRKGLRRNVRRVRSVGRSGVEVVRGRRGQHP